MGLNFKEVFQSFGTSGNLAFPSQIFERPKHCTFVKLDLFCADARERTKAASMFSQHRLQSCFSLC